MKHKRLVAAVLAAALWLTGCGGAAAPAAPAGSGAAAQSTADTAVQTAQKTAHRAVHAGKDHPERVRHHL